jgi:hypothetical protein
MFDSRVKKGAVAVALFLVLLIMFMIISVDFVHAFGISTPYLENNTLKVNSGSNYTYALSVQNGDAEDYYVDISYSSTNNVVNLRKETSFVPSNSYNNTFYFYINIPSTAKIGENYILEYDAKPRLSNGSNTTTNLEIQRQVNILVVGEAQKNTGENTGVWHAIWTIILIVIILTLILLIIIRVWRLSKTTSQKLDKEKDMKVTNYTISQAINLKEVQVLLEKISDEEFRLPEIRNLFKEKISEFTTHSAVKDIDNVSRRELIRILEKTILDV